jgi:hypothetical protein
MVELADTEKDTPPTDHNVQQLIDAEKGYPGKGITRTWRAPGDPPTDEVILQIGADGLIKLSRDGGTTAPSPVIVDGTAAGGQLGGTYPNPIIAGGVIAPGSAAGGELAGTYPNPSLAPTIGGATTFSSTVTFGSAAVIAGIEVLSSILSPPSFGAAQHNYGPTGIGSARIVQLNPTASVDMTGLSSAGAPVGRVIHLKNVSSSGSTITLKHDSLLSAAANRFYCPGAADILLTFLHSAAFYFDGARWTYHG